MIVSTVYATGEYETNRLPRSVKVQTMNGKKHLNYNNIKYYCHDVSKQTRIDLIDSDIIYCKVDAGVQLFSHCVMDQKQLWER